MPGGAPVGNTNARNGKQWKQAIERALDKRGKGDRTAALDALAEKLLAKIDEGDVSAIREFGDRMDGKAAQSVQLGGDPEGEPIRTQVVVNFPKDAG
jgi:hypothetical protein